MNAPHKSPMIERYCKRGHLRTEESTFERKSITNGKLYIVRECRVCHSLRNSGVPKIGANKTSKWKRFAETQA